MDNFYINIGNETDRNSGSQVVYETVGFTNSETRIYMFPENITGRYVTIQFAPSATQFLSLCEVQVQGTGKIFCLCFYMLLNWSLIK